MTSRLDRLFLLIENGSNTGVRRTAATQLGDVAKYYPHEVAPLLKKVSELLTSKSWDTRVAAGEAVSAIVANIPPQNLNEALGADASVLELPLSWSKEFAEFKFDIFDLKFLLEKGAKLYSSDEGAMIEQERHVNTTSSRKEVMQQLGCGDYVGQEMDHHTGTMQSILKESDLVLHTQKEAGVIGRSVEGVMQNALKRKVIKEEEKEETREEAKNEKEEVKDMMREALKAEVKEEPKTESEPPPPKKLRSSEEASDSGSNSKASPNSKADFDSKCSPKLNSDSKSSPIPYTDSKSSPSLDSDADSISKPIPGRSSNTSSSPSPSCDPDFISKASPGSSSNSSSSSPLLRRFLRLLLTRLWDASWEVRHGAATGLRELLRCARMAAYFGPDALENTAVRVLCTLTLDQVSDFISDDVVAPVRETCAQVLGILCLHLDHARIVRLVGLLLQLCSNYAHWMVAQGGLLGIKYVLAATRDRLSVELLPLVYHDIFHHLVHSHDDDVLAWSASTLCPVTDHLAVVLPAKDIAELVSAAWTLLARLVGRQEGLLSSCAINSLMGLLCALYSTPQVRDTVSERRSDGKNDFSLECCLTLLIPYLYHGLESVRISAVRTISILLREELKIIKRDEQSAASPLFDVSLLNPVMEQLFTSALLHDNTTMLEEVEKIWMVLTESIPAEVLARACLWRIDVWLVLVMQPSHVAYPKDGYLNLPKQLVSNTDQPEGTPATEEKEVEKISYFLGGSQVQLENSVEERDERVLCVRLQVTKLLGVLCHRISEVNVPDLTPQGNSVANYLLETLFLLHLNGKLGLPRLVVGLVFHYWGEAAIKNEADQRRVCALVCEAFWKRAESCLTEAIYYEEILPDFRRMQKLCRDLVVQVNEAGATLDASFNRPGQVLNLTRAEQLVGSLFSALATNIKEGCQQTWSRAHSAVSSTSALQSQFQLRVQAILVCALVRWGWLPSRLSPLIRPLMDALKREVSPALQALSSTAMARLLSLVSCSAQTGGANPCPKVIKNISSMFMASCPWTGMSLSSADGVPNKIILTKAIAEAQSAAAGVGGRGQRANSVASESAASCGTEAGSTSAAGGQALRHLELQRRGSRLAFERLCQEFGDGLRDHLPSLWTLLFAQTRSLLAHMPSDNFNSDNLLELLTSLRVLEISYCHLGNALRTEVLVLLPGLFQASGHPDPRLRFQAASVIGAIASVQVCPSLNAVLEHLTPVLKSSSDEFARMGAIETVYMIVNRLELKVLPYLILLLVSCLKAMTDKCAIVRFMTSQVFSSLMTYMPLEVSAPDPEGMSPALSMRRKEKREFLNSLMDPMSIKKYALPIRINAELRPYQQEGINWLAFLNRYNLHGMLCDDLGLGKTLQTICIMAGDHYEMRCAAEKDPSVQVLPSLVICPSTLIGHWLYEVQKFVLDKKDLRPLLYSGTPDWRAELASKMDDYSLVIASYEIVRNDFEVFECRQWNYCVLDEGHIIQNHKAKISRCIRQLSCNHRLILSGTPIQNQVLELWSLFDFLMPGFLGTEQQFSMRYHRPVLLSRDAKASSRDQEAGVLALESLHRQVLPFMLRRMKEDVLSDLPPKIIQDYYCDLTAIQTRLYEALTRSQTMQFDEELLTASSGEKEVPAKRLHVFQTLQCLRKICNHPCLALSKDHHLLDECKRMAALEKKSLKDLDLSGKLIALKQLLLDCGIGASAGSVVSQHRVLIFCQMRAMLDMVEELLKVYLPSATHLRLDGTVPSSQRHDIVLRFNSDPSIDCLLMTTSVGGLGLNLTGADTVIFVEHDWNPMKDLQAMDRAHRIGQKRVVNVYRILTRDTLEEKIMGLQKFKLSVANTVVSAENSSLASMGTGHLLELFEDSSQSSGAEKKRKASGGSNLKALLARMEDSWAEGQYENEYSMASFVRKLGSTSDRSSND